MTNPKTESLDTTGQERALSDHDKVDALAKAFCLLDSFAGDGLGHVYGNGQTIDADDTVLELCAAFDRDPEPGWWRALAADILALPHQPETDEGEGVTVEHHGDWLVWHQPWPIKSRSFDWHYAHKDAVHHDELRTGNDESREMCLQAIDWLEQEEARAQTEEGKARTKEFVDSGMRTLNRALLAHSMIAVLATPGVTDLLAKEVLQNAQGAVEQYQEQTNG